VVGDVDPGGHVVAEHVLDVGEHRVVHVEAAELGQAGGLADEVEAGLGAPHQRHVEAGPAEIDDGRGGADRELDVVGQLGHGGDGLGYEHDLARGDPARRLLQQLLDRGAEPERVGEHQVAGPLARGRGPRDRRADQRLGEREGIGGLAVEDDGAGLFQASGHFAGSQGGLVAAALVGGLADQHRAVRPGERDRRHRGLRLADGARLDVRPAADRHGTGSRAEVHPQAVAHLVSHHPSSRPDTGT
jgi:hypothetical protein